MSAQLAPSPEAVVIEPFRADQWPPYEVADFYDKIRRDLTASGRKYFSEAENQDCYEQLQHIEDVYVTPGNFWIARDVRTSQLVGSVGLRELSEGEGYVGRLGRRDDYRGTGLGPRLMGTVMRWAMGHDFQQLVLETGPKQGAIGLYKSFGFEIIGSMIEDRDHLMKAELA